MSERQYVVVTVTSDGIVHVYTVGDGPTTRGRARTLAKQMEAEDRAQYPDKVLVKFYVREVIDATVVHDKG